MPSAGRWKSRNLHTLRRPFALVGGRRTAPRGVRRARRNRARTCDVYLWFERNAYLGARRANGKRRSARYFLKGAPNWRPGRGCFASAGGRARSSEAHEALAASRGFSLAPAASSLVLTSSASCLETFSLTFWGRAFDQVLGFLEAQVRTDRADFLDHVDLLLAGAGEDDGELGLLLGGFGRRRGGRPAAAMATGAAAETPHFSSSSLESSAASSTVRAERSSTSFSSFDMAFFLGPSTES